MGKSISRYFRLFLCIAVGVLIFVGSTGCEVVDLTDVREMIVAAIINGGPDDGPDAPGGSTVPTTPASTTSDGTKQAVTGRVLKKTSVEAVPVESGGFKVKIQANTREFKTAFDGFHQPGKPLAAPDAEKRDERLERRAVLLAEREALIEKAEAERAKLKAEMELVSALARKAIAELEGELKPLRERLAVLASDSGDRPGILDRISDIEYKLTTAKQDLAKRTDRLGEAIRAADERLRTLKEEYDALQGEQEDGPPLDNGVSPDTGSAGPAGTGEAADTAGASSSR